MTPLLTFLAKDVAYEGISADFTLPNIDFGPVGSTIDRFKVEDLLGMHCMSKRQPTRGCIW